MEAKDGEPTGPRVPVVANAKETDTTEFGCHESDRLSH